MSGLSKTTTSLLVVIAAVDLGLFSNMTILTLAAYIMGALCVVLGIQYSYRSASLLGLLIVGTAAAASMEFTTILHVSPLMAAISGLMVPMFVITWTALSVNEEGYPDLGSSRRGVATSIFYAGLVLVSAPLVSLVISFVLPTITTRFTTVTEIAIILMTLIISGVVLTRERSRAGASIGTKTDQVSEK